MIILLYKRDGTMKIERRTKISDKIDETPSQGEGEADWNENRRWSNKLCGMYEKRFYL